MESNAKFIEELEKHLPIYFNATPQLCRSMRQQGIILKRNAELKASNVVDSGDMGGILCVVEDDNNKRVFMVSLTHLKIKQDHPLCNKVSDYQRRRVKTLGR